MLKSSQPEITITEVTLNKDYEFMYEGFVVSSQQSLFLLLKKTGDRMDALKFDFLLYKYGYPNDEASHPMAVYGLGTYGLFKVDNSPWISEVRNNNKSHHRHTDEMFENDTHYIARFKDVTLEVICTKMEEIELTKVELLAFISEEINILNF